MDGRGTIQGTTEYRGTGMLARLVAVYIVRRSTSKGEARFVVRYRAGRYDPVTHLGSFKTRREAAARQAWAEMELAAGRVPDRRRVTQAARRVTVDDAIHDYLATRIDAAESSRASWEKRAKMLHPVLGEHDAHTLTDADVQRFLAAGGRAVETLKGCMSVLRQALDHAGVDPNPAASRRLRYPRKPRTEKQLPTRQEIAAVRSVILERHAVILDALEHTGMRISEVVALRSADVDAERGRVLVRFGKTLNATRWVDYTPEWCAWEPPAARPSGRLYDGPRGAVRAARVEASFRDACDRASVPRFTPHTLRHLHASRLLHYGWLSPAEIAARLGHATPSFTLTTYAHLVPPD